MNPMVFAVYYEDGNYTNIKISEFTPMYKVLRACCDRLGMNHENYILSKGGVQIDERKNAAQNGIKNGDKLEIEGYVAAKHGNFYE